MDDPGAEAGTGLESVGHQEDLVPPVLQARVVLTEVALHLEDKLIVIAPFKEGAAGA
ncbi:hypothetical protein ARTHRO9V_150215 [Arthrobacter sp. 9V]|uniref:hypothetical protein n=1 Tax=Arthrobacter sp. 9V TaxID=2653132 RepID=UPI0012F1405F|nr:hypothetical protein [Arthrobacter sp. 9V]VXB43605.1 hypothetical protein ARTHRO9V_150215 [Arthrobacter sp. 9V]